MSSEKLPSDRPPISSAVDAAARLGAIVEAAERAAAQVIDEAEAEARRTIEEARAQADRVVADRLRELAEELESPPPAGGAARAPHLRPVEPPPAEEEPAGGEPAEAEEGPAPRGDGEARARSAAVGDGSAAARLLATQMAVSGARREEIEARLRKAFDIDDAGPILDAILGPER